MKKNYVQPKTVTVELKSECLLDGSNFLPNGSDEDPGAKMRIDEYVEDFEW